MSIITKKEEELDGIQTAKFVTSTLRDISATRIRKLKERFNTNVSFYSEISDLYLVVKREAMRRANVGSEHAKKSLKQNKSGSLAVALTSDTQFYGSLNREVMDYFLEHLEKNPGHKALIIGNTGIKYMEEVKSNKNYSTINFDSENPNSKEIRRFLEKVESYNQVDVFYPRFVNVFQQEPGVRDIAYTPEPLEEEEQEEGSKYISEPELSKMLDFFDTQVKSILFQRTILETELSRAAARVVKMDKAEDRAKEMMDDKSKELQKQIAQLQGRRLLETFSGYQKWKENK